MPCLGDTTATSTHLRGTEVEKKNRLVSVTKFKKEILDKDHPVYLGFPGPSKSAHPALCRCLAPGSLVNPSFIASDALTPSHGLLGTLPGCMEGTPTKTKRDGLAYSGPLVFPRPIRLALKFELVPDWLSCLPGYPVWTL